MPRTRSKVPRRSKLSGLVHDKRVFDETYAFTRPDPVSHEAFLYLHDELLVVWGVCQSVFGDKAEPQHAVMLLPSYLDHVDDFEKEVREKEARRGKGKPEEEEEDENEEEDDENDEPSRRPGRRAAAAAEEDDEEDDDDEDEEEEEEDP